MTPFPHSVELDVTAQAALDLMRVHAIRHLPVTKNHVAYSLVNDEAIAREAALSGRDTKAFPVSEVCERDPYLVELNTPLDEVLSMMEQRLLTCVVATRGDRVAGVFTQVDAYRLLVRLLTGDGPPPDDVA